MMRVIYQYLHQKKAKILQNKKLIIKKMKSTKDFKKFLKNMVSKIF